MGDDVTIQLGENTNLDVDLSIALSQIDSFSWINTSTLNCSDCFDPIAQPTETTTYEAIVYDLNGCFASDQLTVFVEQESDVFIPNIFSPNGDNNNDLFTIYSSQGVKCIVELRIYDRWGNNVFTNFDFLPNDNTLGWNGKYKGLEVNPGVFVYWAKVEFINGRTELFKGDVTVLK